jgi:hypothetical protein
MRKRWLLCLSIACSLFAISCSNKSQEQARPVSDAADSQERFMEEKKSLPSPANAESFPTSQQEAARAVAAALRERGEKPEEFHARVETKEADNILVFNLWHESAFAKRDGLVAGNPGGKCRNVYYDRKTKQVTQMLFWQ